MVRDTSAEAYRHIEGLGVLSAMQRKVYEYLLRHGPMTGGELDDRLGGDSGKRGHYHKRLSELQEMNAAKEHGQRKCSVTGRRSIVWIATQGPVGPMNKRKSRADLLYDLCTKTADYLEHQHATSGWSNKQIADHIRRRLGEIG